MREPRLILETPRLLLREFMPSDLNALLLVLSDPETMQHYPAPLDQGGAIEWIKRNQCRYRNYGHGLWAMVLKSSMEVIGDCGLIPQKVDGTDEIEIGYHVRKDLWNHGLATEAARACKKYGFQNLSVSRLISLIRPENLSSRRVAEKNGMTVWKEIQWRDFAHLVYAIEGEGSQKNPQP